MCKKDILIWIYAALTGSFFLFLYFAPIINMVFELGPYMVLIFGILAFTWLVILLICLIKNIWLRHWRRTVFIIVLPIFAVLLFKMLYWANITPERLRLEYNRASYMKEIAELQTEDNSPHLKTWRWGRSPIFPAGLTDYILLYDDSDQITLPNQSRTAAWKQRFVLTKHSEFLSSNPENWNERLIVEPLGEHFYLIIR
jgi:hypothetical protein